MDICPKQAIGLLLNNFKKNYQTILRIEDFRTYKNKHKELEGFFRRFQAEASKDIGLILFYNNLVCRQRLKINELKLLETNREVKQFRLENPFVKREQQFEEKQKKAVKINMKDFIC